jgi:uncharacterized protein (UPF0548 family)
MLLLHPPTAPQIRRFLAAQARLPFSYPAVGATRTVPPPRQVVDHNRVQLGTGPACWAAAQAALRRWEMFHLGWVWLYRPSAPIRPGTVVGVVSRQWGFWTLNACRIVYAVDEAGPPHRFGFAYGTLPDHLERGEERFTVEYHPDGAVWYDILAFSRPQHPLAYLGFPVVRLYQRRFARDSKRAMQAAVAALLRET